MFKHIDSYLKGNPTGYWFKRVIYGWLKPVGLDQIGGWVPVRWQGWLVLFVYIVLVTGLALTINEHTAWREVLFTFIVPIIFLTIALIRICYKTSERSDRYFGLEKINTDTGK